LPRSTSSYLVSKVVLENSHDSVINYLGIHLTLKVSRQKLKVSHQKLKVKKFHMNLAGDYLILHENLPDRGDFFW